MESQGKPLNSGLMPKPLNMTYESIEEDLAILYRSMVCLDGSEADREDWKRIAQILDSFTDQLGVQRPLVASAHPRTDKRTEAETCLGIQVVCTGLQLNYGISHTNMHNEYCELQRLIWQVLERHQVITIKKNGDRFVQIVDTDQHKAALTLSNLLATEEALRVRIEVNCLACRGTGLYAGYAEPDGVAVICDDCKGTGAVMLDYSLFTGRKKRGDVTTVRSRFNTANTVTYQQFLAGKVPEE